MGLSRTPTYHFSRTLSKELVLKEGLILKSIVSGRRFKLLATSFF